MSGERAALAVLRYGGDRRAVGHELVDPAAPVLTALDLSATRGDGVFETLSVGDGRPQALEAHLVRFARSASLLDLPAPDLDVWRDAIRTVAGALAPVAEGLVKAVLSRGVEGTGIPTGWAYAAVAPDHTAARTEGVRVALLDRGMRHDAGRDAPWLLIGVKTLSYGVNRAAAREAAARGADDAVFVSTDGLLLEGPTANVVLLRDGRLLTPPLDAGILPGTTQADLYAWAPSQGLEPLYQPLTPQELRDADAAWLVSSVRHAAPIRAVDHAELPVDRALSDAMNAFLRDRTS